MENDTKARVAFAAVLLFVGVAGAVWYLAAVSHYATYQIYTQDAVSGLIADAPVEFHGVEVGKVKSVRLVDPHSVAIVLLIDKAAPVTSASVATITSRGVATRGFTGYVYIALEDVGTDTQPLAAPPGEPYPVIATAPSKVVTMDTAISQVSEVLQALLDKKTIGSLKQSADSLQQVLPEAQKALSALTELANKLNRDPSILLRGSPPTKPGPGERK